MELAIDHGIHLLQDDTRGITDFFGQRKSTAERTKERAARKTSGRRTTRALGDVERSRNEKLKAQKQREKQRREEERQRKYDAFIAQEKEKEDARMRDQEFDEYYQDLDEKYAGEDQRKQRIFLAKQALEQNPFYVVDPDIREDVLMQIEEERAKRAKYERFLKEQRQMEEEEYAEQQYWEERDKMEKDRD